MAVIRCGSAFGSCSFKTGGSSKSNRKAAITEPLLETKKIKKINRLKETYEKDYIYICVCVCARARMHARTHAHARMHAREY